MKKMSSTAKYVATMETGVNGHVMEGKMYIFKRKFESKLLEVGRIDSLQTWEGTPG